MSMKRKPENKVTSLFIPSIEEARREPVPSIANCKVAFDNFEKKYRQRLLKTILAAYAADYELARDINTWRNFVKIYNEVESLKKKLKVDKSFRCTLLPVMRFIFGWTHDYDRAYKYARALEMCSIEGVAPEELQERIEKAHGIEALYKQACKEIPYKGKDEPGKSAARLAYKQRHQAGCYADLLNENKKEESGLAPKGEAGAAGASINKPIEAPPLELAIDPSRLGRLRKLKPGQERYLRIRCVEHRIDGWVEFSVQRIGLKGSARN